MIDRLIILRFRCCGVGSEISLERLKSIETRKFICPDCGAPCEYDEADLAELERDSYGHGPYELELLPE
jgi:hypothetical protein